MKNLVKLKSILSQAFLIGGSLIFVSACSESKTTDSKDVAEEENIEKLAGDDQIAVIDNDIDAMFLMEAAEMQLEEISLGKLAQQNGTAADVKELGKMMEADHSKNLSELSALAQAKSISIPTSITNDSKDAHDKLADKTGTEFDKAYSDLMVEKHEDAIDKFEKASTDSEDAEIKSWAASKLPGLKTHLEHAKACKDKSQKSA